MTSKPPGPACATVPAAQLNPNNLTAQAALADVDIMRAEAVRYLGGHACSRCVFPSEPRFGGLSPVAWECPECHRFDAYTEAELSVIGPYIKTTSQTPSVSSSQPHPKLVQDMQTLARVGCPIPTSVSQRLAVVQSKSRNPLRLSFFKDRKKETRWRMVRSGRVVATSGEGYSSEAKAKQTLVRLLATISTEAYVWDKEPVKAKTPTATKKPTNGRV